MPHWKFLIGGNSDPYADNYDDPNSDDYLRLDRGLKQNVTLESYYNPEGTGTNASEYHEQISKEEVEGYSFDDLIDNMRNLFDKRDGQDEGILRNIYNNITVEVKCCFLIMKVEITSWKLSS